MNTRSHLWLWILSCVLVQSQTHSEHLRWTDPNTPGTVDSFTVQVRGPLPATGVRAVTIRTNRVDLDLLFDGLPSGMYWASAISHGRNGLSSRESEKILVPWTSSKSISSLCTNVIAQREGTGILVQLFHDKAHTFSATEFKPKSSGRVCRIEMNFRTTKPPSGEITIYVWKDSRGRPGPLIATSAARIQPNEITDGWYGARIDVERAAGQTYWIGVGNSTSDFSGHVLWIGGGDGTRWYSGDGANWIFSGAQGMNFRVYN